jgi:hypothetical protein
MKKINQAPLTRRSALLGMAGAVAQLSGCGGGSSDVAGLSSGGTGSFTSGTITGFGSIIVNGIRYNDDDAAVFATDGLASDVTQLQLGMVVHIEGSTVKQAPTTGGLPTATAYRINYDSEWIGPVSNINGMTFEILGHTVEVQGATFIDGEISDYADLTTAHFVEIHGYVDKINKHIDASRITVTSVRPAYYKLSGAVSIINRTNKTALLGPTPIAWLQPSDFSDSIANDDFIRVRLNTTPVHSAWIVSRIDQQSSPVALLSANFSYEAEVHGCITEFRSGDNFAVNGIWVDASSASIAGILRAGAAVEVEGNIRAGKLIATAIEVKSLSEANSQEYEFYGLVTNLTPQTFDVRGQTFYYDADTRNMDLIIGVTAPRIEVKATRTNGSWYAIAIDNDD